MTVSTSITDDLTGAEVNPAEHSIVLVSVETGPFAGRSVELDLGSESFATHILPLLDVQGEAIPVESSKPSLPKNLEEASAEIRRLLASAPSDLSSIPGASALMEFVDSDVVQGFSSDVQRQVRLVVSKAVTDQVKSRAIKKLGDIFSSDAQR